MATPAASLHSSRNGSPQRNGDHSLDETVISTPSGTVRVKPYVPVGSKQLKAMLQFSPRHSSFNRENTKSQRDEFRGFFVLFWIALALVFIRTSLQSWEENQTVLSLNFGRLITRDMFVLMGADLIMVTSMLLCVPFVQCLKRGWIDYWWAGLLIQHTFQAIFLGVAIMWGRARNWYWVQAGFLVLHSLSSLMKMHSYMSHNGMLAEVYKRLQIEKRTLDDYLSTLDGGREAALAEAAQHKAGLEAREAAAPQISAPGTPLAETPARSETPKITVTSDDGVDTVAATLARYEDGAGGLSSATARAVMNGGANGLNSHGPKRRVKRSTMPAAASLPEPTKDLPRGTSLEPSHISHPHAPRSPNPLAWSSDHRVAILARNIDAMEDELRSNGERGLVWPDNVTYKHFIEFMFFPTLVYQLEYPRTDTIRPLLVIEKVLATFGTFSLIYTVTEHYIMPYTPMPGDSLMRTFVNLAIPMMINFLLIFYIIFECVCVGFAELSYFADREFYQDWWNSTTWDEFARKWNKPVHTFLLRHVYDASRNSMGLSRWGATLFTFLLSALCHELVMCVVSKKVRPYLFLMQMLQLPMIALSRLPAVKHNKTLGNIVFWVGLMLGFPALEICYLVY